MVLASPLRVARSEGLVLVQRSLEDDPEPSDLLVSEAERLDDLRSKLERAEGNLTVLG